MGKYEKLCICANCTKKAAFQPNFLDAVFLVFTDLFYIYKYKESTCSH